MDRRKVLIDCDPGTDDTMALFMALSGSDIEVVAITTVVGNAGLERSSINTLRALKRCGRLDIPVYPGCATNFLGSASPMSGYHGLDGLGDTEIPDVDPVDLNLLQKEHAASAIVRILSENPGEITLVCLGALTNIALALHLDLNLGHKLKGFVAMGGNIEGKGNINTSAEFNFFVDPEAVHFVLDKIGVIIILAPMEVCLEYSLPWEVYDRLPAIGTKKADMIVAINASTIGGKRAVCPDKHRTFDELAMAFVLNPDVAVETKDVFATVELTGAYTRGQLIVDWNQRLGKSPNVRLITKVDMALFGRLYLQGVDDRDS